MRLAANIGRKKSPKFAIWAPSYNFVGLYLRNYDTYRQSEKSVKQQHLLHTTPQYGELQPTNGWDRSDSLGHPSKFQRVSRLNFVTAATSLNGSQPNSARCLAASWAGTLYIHFQGLLPLMEFCQVQSWLCVQVLRSPILAALLHSTRVVGVVRNGITELSQRAPPVFGRAAITLGNGQHSSLFTKMQKYSLLVWSAVKLFLPSPISVLPRGHINYGRPM